MAGWVALINTLLSPAQRMHVQCERLYRRWVQPGIPRRHNAHPRCGDLRHHGCPVIAVEMHLRGKPRRALLAVALSGIAMTDRAILGENLLARRYVLARIGVAKQRHDIVGDLLDFGRLQYAIGAEARHLRLAR